MCTLITTPTTVSAAPWWRMWTGVMLITPTMTAWATRDRDEPEQRQTANDASLPSSPGRRSGRGDARPRSNPTRATTSGSGRSHTATTRPPSTNEAIEKTNGPLSSGRCSQVAVRPPTPLRFGPATAPTVVAHTTVDSARPRPPSVAQSVAAYRACRLVALAAPNTVMPTSSSAKEPAAAATTTSTAPSAPMR